VLAICNRAPHLVTIEELAAACQIFTFLTVRWDQYAVQCKTREGRSSRLPLFSHLENCIGSKPHQSSQLPGCCRKVSSRVCSFCSLPGPLPTRPNDQPTQSIMKTFLSFLAAYVAAGSLAVAFVMTAAESPLQYSGTQRYVRMVR